MVTSGLGTHLSSLKGKRYSCFEQELVGEKIALAHLWLQVKGEKYSFGMLEKVALGLTPKML